MGLRSNFVKRTPYGKSLLEQVDALTAERNRLRKQLERYEVEAARGIAETVAADSTEGAAPGAGFCEDDIVRLASLGRRGFRPGCVFDAGASNGLWSRLLSETFPEADFHLFEPLADIEAQYVDVLAKHVADNPKFTLHKTALGSRTGKIKFQQGSDPFSSSLLDSGAVGAFSSVEVDITTIDDVIKSKGLPAPDLLKMDVQGAELDILKGAEKTLPKIELLLIETWLTRAYGKDTPLYHELITWLLPRGFHLIDFATEYRNDEGELLAQDILFVNESSDLRKALVF